jgi:hypothetical protein
MENLQLPNMSFLHRFPYNSPPTLSLASIVLPITPWHGSSEKTALPLWLQLFPWEHVCLRRHYSVMAAHTCLLRICCLAVDVVSLFGLRSLPSNESTHYSYYVYWKHDITVTRLEVFMAVRIQVVVFWVITWYCCLVGGFQCLEGNVYQT